MAKIFKLLILLPIAIIVIALAIANRQVVSVSVDPFTAPEVGTGIVAAPLFILLFLALIVGIILGGCRDLVHAGQQSPPGSRGPRRCGSVAR